VKEKISTSVKFVLMMSCRDEISESMRPVLDVCWKLKNDVGKGMDWIVGTSVV
jgi:hypothetical protein